MLHIKIKVELFSIRDRIMLFDSTPSFSIKEHPKRISEQKLD